MSKRSKDYRRFSENESFFVLLFFPTVCRINNSSGSFSPKEFYEILLISSRTTLATKFLSHIHRQTHRQADRQTFSKNN